ncbi:MAG: hypothetical protein HC808_10175 [Candidatus Competibacteraceae bacterium]|nr:hypothetical protein [Candidatus Competibacteraceae bacterium]
MPKMKGKPSGWFAGRPQAAALSEAQAIKTKYLEREQRSQAKQAKRLQRKFIPIQPVLESE